jgi:hypothetical protein
VQADAHTLAVEQMRPGDHAFAHYADDNVRWHVPAAFTQRGLGHGEKVIIMVFGSMRALIHPDRAFTARRQLSRLREETARARWEGYAGLVPDELAEDR